MFSDQTKQDLDTLAQTCRETKISINAPFRDFVELTDALAEARWETDYQVYLNDPTNREFWDTFNEEPKPWQSFRPLYHEALARALAERLNDLYAREVYG